MSQTYGQTDFPAFPSAYAESETEAPDTIGGIILDDPEPETAPEDEPAAQTAEADDDDEDGSADQGASAGPRTPGSAAAKPNRSYIRKVAAKALEVETSTDTVKSLAAALLGSGEDTVELTVAIMSSGRTAVQPLSDITEVLTALKDEPWSAGIVAAALDAGRQKAVWSVLQARGTAGSTPLPKALAKAAKLIVKAINDLDDTDRAGLTEAGDLLKRS